MNPIPSGGTIARLLASAAAFGLLPMVTAQGPTGICWLSAYGTPLGAGDDTLHAQALPFAFPLPGGGTTNFIDICSNGFVWLNGMPGANDADYTESSAEFVAGPPRIAAMWDDLNVTSSGTFPGGDVYYDGTHPSHAVVTWDVREFAGDYPVTMQLVLFADGSFTITYRNPGRDGLVGITAGNGATDPGEFDFSSGFLIGGSSTVYEHFASETTDPSDLRAKQLWFRPNVAGGYDVAAIPALCFAQKEAYGHGCPTSFVQGGAIYELFLSTNLNDLTASGPFSIRYVNTGNGYGVVPLSSFVWEPAFQNVVNWGSGTGDDSLSIGHALGFTASFGGVQTSTIDIGSNGFLWMVSGSSTSTDLSETAAELCGGPTRLAILWDDLNNNPTSTSGGGAVYFDTFPASGPTPARAVVTYAQVPEYGAIANLNTVQAQLFANGDIVCSYQQVAISDGLIGFSVGNLPAVPATTDFTTDLPALMQFTQINQQPMVLDLAADTLPYLGGAAAYECRDLNGALAVVLHLAVTQAPGTDLTFLGMPGCAFYADASLASGPMPISAGVASLTLTIPNLAALTGATVYNQAIAFVPGINPRSLIASNGLRMVLGN